MIPSPRRPDSIAEIAIVAVVVIVLGVAASRTKVDGPDDVDRLAAQVRMTSPLAYACAPSRDVRGPNCPMAASDAPDR